MISALPKRKHRPQKQLRELPSPRGFPRSLKIARNATIVAILVLALCRGIVGKWLGQTTYMKTQFLKEYKVLQQKSIGLQNEIQLLTSPLAIEDLAKKTNMNQPTKVYYLRLGKL